MTIVEDFEGEFEVPRTQDMHAFMQRLSAAQEGTMLLYKVPPLDPPAPVRGPAPRAPAAARHALVTRCAALRSATRARTSRRATFATSTSSTWATSTRAICSRLRR